MFAKKVGFVLLGFALVSSPALAGAQSVDTQTQIAALLAQVKQLQAQIAQLEGDSGESQCVNLSSDLTLGSTGSDVTNLQNYLIANGDLGAQYSTGYYGFLTAQAVGKLQVFLGIVSSSGDPAYGIMGPQTRGALTCQNQTAEEANSPRPSVSLTAPTLTASPSSGTAPLSVTFATSPIASSALSGGIPSILFGDSVGTMQQSSCTASPTACIYSASHTYSLSGTYTASVLSPLQTILASTTVSATAVTGVQNQGTINQVGQTLSLATNPQLTGTIPTTYAAAQVWAIPSVYTGATDYTTLWDLSTGLGLGEGQAPPDVRAAGTSVNSTGQWSIPLSTLTSTPGNYTIVLFGIPQNDPIGPYHDSTFDVLPTLLASTGITVTP